MNEPKERCTIMWDNPATKRRREYRRAGRTRRGHSRCEQAPARSLTGSKREGVPETREHRQVIAQGDAAREHPAQALEEQKSWSKWMAKHPDWNAGAWDALPVEDKRKAVRKLCAPAATTISTPNSPDPRAAPGSLETILARYRQNRAP